MGEAAEQTETAPYVVMADASDPTAWHAAREGLVTASRVAAVLGLDPHCSALERWLMDTGQQEDDVGDSEAVYWGNKLEEVIRQAYEERTERPTKPAQRLLRSTQYPWLGATLDAWWQDEDGLWWPLEVKTGGHWRGSDWDLGVPDYYMPQVQTQMLVTGTERAAVAGLIGGQRPIFVDVERDEEMCARIVEATREYARCVEDWEPPAPDGSDSAGRALLQLYPEADGEKSVMLGDDAVQITERLDEINAQMRALGKEKDALRQQIQAAIGDAEIGLLPQGKKCWAWRTQHRRAYTVDEKTMRVLRKVNA